MLFWQPAFRGMSSGDAEALGREPGFSGGFCENQILRGRSYILSSGTFFPCKYFFTTKWLGTPATGCPI
jgi:hypothetical protein